VIVYKAARKSELILFNADCLKFTLVDLPFEWV